jgi:hypothetical protein
MTTILLFLTPDLEKPTLLLKLPHELTSVTSTTTTTTTMTTMTTTTTMTTSIANERSPMPFVLLQRNSPRSCARGKADSTPPQQLWYHVC